MEGRLALYTALHLAPLATLQRHRSGRRGFLPSGLARMRRAVKVDVDWAALVARQDRVWNRLPWDDCEGPFVRNGLMG